jgi:hypothetical protein
MIHILLIIIIDSIPLVPRTRALFRRFLHSRELDYLSLKTVLVLRPHSTGRVLSRPTSAALSLLLNALDHTLHKFPLISSHLGGGVVDFLHEGTVILQKLGESLYSSQ